MTKKRKPHVAMTDPETVHCCFDIETLGNRDDSPIVQIGAVLFNPFGTGSPHGSPVNGGSISAPGSEFNMHIEIKGPVDPATLMWWFAQGQDAQERVFGRGLDRWGMHMVLNQFAEWSRSWGQVPDFWWSDMDFDLRMMRAAWDAQMPVGRGAPFGTDNGPHRGVRDCRTLRAIGRDLGIDEPLFVGVEHDALDDAHHQAIYTSNVLRRILCAPLDPVVD